MVTLADAALRAAVFMLTVTAAVLPAAPVAPARQEFGPVSPRPVPVGRDWNVAQRVDDHRVVVLFGGGALYVPQRELETLPVRAVTRTRAPGRLFDVPPGRVTDIIGDKAHIGDRWVLDAGRKGRFHFTVEQFVLGYKDCGEAWGVLARVTTDEGARFEAVAEKYYIARLERGDDAGPAATRVGPIVFSLDVKRRDELSVLLERERQRTWPALRSTSQQDYARQEASGRKWPARWRQLDARLDRGEARLTFDVQAFRLTPDGDPRLFVRARWTAGGALVYVMSAWVRVTSVMTLEQSDVTAAGSLRMSEFQYSDFDDEYLGLVLNVVDTDGDGYAELLMLRAGYESRNVRLVDTPGVSGQRRESFIEYGDGC